MAQRIPAAVRIQVMTRPATAALPSLTYKGYIARLRFFCRQKGLRLRRLGAVGGHPLFQVVAGVRRPRRTVIFSAGIHGDEISGPLAILELIRRFDWRSLRRTRVVLLPVGNPWGFDHHRRTNAAGRDLNRGFGGKLLCGENRLLYDAVKDEKPELFLSLHEDDEQGAFYMYAYGRPEERSAALAAIKADGRRYIPLARSRRIDGHPAVSGVIFNIRDRSFEHRSHLDGIGASLCLELPDRQPLPARIKAGVAVMAGIINRRDLAQE